MKEISKMLVALTAVILGAPAFAQSHDPHANEQWSLGAKNDSQLERSIVKAARNSQQRHEEGLLHQAEALLQKDRDEHDGYAKHTLEYYYDLLKSGRQPAGEAVTAPDRDPALLHQAEALLQKDREEHGGYAKHTLDYYYKVVSEQGAKAAPAKKTEYCIYCGNPIVKDYQKCPAQELAPCRSTCPDCGKDLNNPKHLINGEHRCRFKTRITPVAPKIQENNK